MVEMQWMKCLLKCNYFALLVLQYDSKDICVFASSHLVLR